LEKYGSTIPFIAGFASLCRGKGRITETPDRHLFMNRTLFLSAYLQNPSPFCRRKFRRFCVGALFLLSSLQAGFSQPLIGYSREFDGAEGTLPTGWVAQASTNGYAAQSGAGTLNVGTNAGGSGIALAAFKGDFGPIENGVVTDATLETVLITSSGANWVGLAGRAQDGDSASPGGYYALINRKQSSLAIWDAAPSSSGTSADEALAHVAIAPALTNNTQYRLILDLQGSTITASLYSLDAEVGVDDPLATVSANSTLYGSGLTGFWGFYGGASRSTRYESFTITTIPEPSAAALGSLIFTAGAVVLGLRGKKLRPAGRFLPSRD